MVVWRCTSSPSIERYPVVQSSSFFCHRCCFFFLDSLPCKALLSLLEGRVVYLHAAPLPYSSPSSGGVVHLPPVREIHGWKVFSWLVIFSTGSFIFLLFLGVFSWIYGYHEFLYCHGCCGEDFGGWNGGVGDRNSVKEVEGWLGFLVWFWVIGGREDAKVFLCGFFFKFELTFSQNLMVARVFGRKYEVRVF